MIDRDDGGPAFPMPETDRNPECVGMSLRDYFAAKAMQGWLASCGNEVKHPTEVDGGRRFVQQAYAMADAMLEARKQ